MLRTGSCSSSWRVVVAGLASPKAWSQELQAPSDWGLGLSAVWTLWVLVLALILGLAFFFYRRYQSTQQDLGDANSSPSTWSQSDARALPQYNPKNVGNDASARPWEGDGFDLKANALQDLASKPNPNSRFESQLVKPIQVKMPNFHPISAGVQAPKSQAQSQSQSPATPTGLESLTHPRAHAELNIDQAQFLAMAKSHFLSLQEAWDHHDLSRVHEFLSEDIFAQVQLQVQGWANSADNTPRPSEVLWLEAHWMGWDTRAEDLLASVELSGMVKEGLNASPTPFTEIWTWKRLLNDHDSIQAQASTPSSEQFKWVVCGLEALQS